MGQFSLTHILLFLIIVLVFFGPSRLPGLGKSLGEAIRGFKKGLEGENNGNSNQAQQDQRGAQPPPENHQVSTRHVSPLELSESDNENQSQQQRTTRKTDNYS